MTLSREFLKQKFSIANCKSARVSVLELAEIIGIENEKIRDYHFDELFRFVFNSEQDVENFIFEIEPFYRKKVESYKLRMSKCDFSLRSACYHLSRVRRQATGGNCSFS